MLLLRIARSNEMIALNMLQFILGIGAPKAGTFWLRRRLSSSESVNSVFLKEYLVFVSIVFRRVIGLKTS